MLFLPNQIAIFTDSTQISTAVDANGGYAYHPMSEWGKQEDS